MDPAAHSGVQPGAGGALWMCPVSSNGIDGMSSSSAQFAISQPGPSSAPTYAPTPFEEHKLRLEEHKVQLELARETIRLRELELQIASEKRREREVELELVKWKANAEQSQPLLLNHDNSAGEDHHTCTHHLASAGSRPLRTFGPALNGPEDFSVGEQPTLAQQPDFTDPNLINTLGFQPFLPVTSGDPDSQAFDNILRELLANDPTYLPSTDMSMDGGLGLGSFNMGDEAEESQDDIEPVSHSETTGVHSPTDSSSQGVTGTTPLDALSPAPGLPTSTNGHLPSAASSSTPELITLSTPLASNTRSRSKKQVISHTALCSRCNTPIAKLFLRGTTSELADEFTMHYLCERCASPVPSASGRARKRVKQTEDVSLPTVCDVCLRGRGRGGIIPRQRGRAVRFAVEVVCLPCTEKYKRCSDCGGGSGRLGVGKWRCKELFYEARKTCNLSHARLGTGELELAVWDVPTDVAGDPQVSQVLESCEALWRDNVLRLAVPEILDSDQESPLGLRSYKDIQTKILDRGWPAKEHIMKDEEEGKKKYLALTWAKTRPRRSKGVKDPKDAVTKDENFLFGNMRRTKIFYPAGCNLVGMWICNWDIGHRAIHMSTTCPFDARDFEDQSIVSIAETFSRIVSYGMQPTDTSDALVPPSHWWMTYDIISPAMSTRIEDILIKRKRCFPLSEYIQRYPDVTEDNFVEPLYTRIVDPSLWPTTHLANGNAEAKDEPVMAIGKFLGNSINWLRMQKLNQRIYDKRLNQALSKKRKTIEDKPLGEVDGVGPGNAEPAGKRRDRDVSCREYVEPGDYRG